MTASAPLFQSTTGKKTVTPAKLGIGLLAFALVAITLTVVLILDSRSGKYKEGQTRFPGVQYQGSAGFTQYQSYLVITRAAGQVSENLLGGQQAVVAGDIENRGSRTVDVVEIQTLLYNEEGKLVQQFVKTPVQPDFPLLPKERRRFSIWVEPFPPEWLSGRIEVVIHGYRIKG